MTETFAPSRLRIARERRRISQKDLAAACDVSPQTLSNWESGETLPSQEHQEALAHVLEFPLSFFAASDLEPLPEGAATFRARTKIPAREKSSAIAAGTLARELAQWIESRFELPEVSIPDLSGQNPELAADVIRSEWMLGDRPVPNVTRLLESRGVLILSLAQDCKEIDAFSFRTATGRPILLLSTMKSPDRSRLDAAHELAHLVLHREETGKAEERQADSFAGSFLMPKADIYRHVRNVSRLEQLIDVKKRWGVSLAALVYRLHVLGILTDWQYRSLFMELSKRGYRTKEPQPQPLEPSVLLSQIFGFLRSEGLSARRIANELRWHPEELNGLIFGLGATLFSIEGGKNGQRQGLSP